MGAVEDTLTRPKCGSSYIAMAVMSDSGQNEKPPRSGLCQLLPGCGLLLAVRLSSAAAALTAVRLARPSTKPSAAAVRG